MLFLYILPIFRKLKISRRMRKIIITTLFLIVSQLCFGQGSDIQYHSSQNFVTADSVFNYIKEGLKKGEVEEFSEFLSGKTYISLSNGKTGYFSTDQIYYILEDFFDSYKTFAFTYSTVKAGAQKPFASGTLKYLNNGKRKSAKVFISLSRITGKWKIAQLTIN